LTRFRTPYCREKFVSYVDRRVRPYIRLRYPKYGYSIVRGADLEREFHQRSLFHLTQMRCVDRITNIPRRGPFLDNHPRRWSQMVSFTHLTQVAKSNLLDMVSDASDSRVFVIGWLLTRRRPQFFFGFDLFVVSHSFAAISRLFY